MTPFNYLKQVKVAVLTLLVLGSFMVISFGWHRNEPDASIRCKVAAAILLIMYTLIIFELVNRNLAALIGAALSIAAHDLLIGYVNAEDILKWEDLDTLALLFGMMIVVGVLNQSGIFDYLAVWSYKSSAGHFWLLVSIMSLITGIISATLDNVSTMLLMSPTIIKLSELENIDPRYMLMMMVVSANIGGCATPIGDPPNLIIIGSSLAKSLKITFGSFTAYVAPATILALVTVLAYLKLIYNSKESFRLNKTEIQDMITTPSNQVNVINRQQRTKSVDDDDVVDTPVLIEMTDCKMQIRSDADISELMRTHAIKSKPILARALLVMIGAILLFFLQSLPGANMTLGSISLFAGLTLLVMCSSLKVPSKSGEEQRDDVQLHKEEVDLFDEVIYNIEWSTLIFFFALFIVMEAMSKLGLTLFMGEQITNLINLIPSGRMRSIGAITIILWSSGIASACIDNVPFTLVMVKILKSMVSENSDSSLDGKPLVYALVLGACLGGNGSLIGASCNLVTAGISDRHGYPITFNSFFRFAAPITLLTLVVSNIYLILLFEILKL